MAKKNPTIGELFEEVTENKKKHNLHFEEDYKIVRGGCSRSVLNNFDTEVLSYGLGFKGFVAIYKNKAGFLKATGYELFWIYSGFSKGKFIDLLPVEADAIIRNNDTFKHKKLVDNIYKVKGRVVKKNKYEELGRVEFIKPDSFYRHTQHTWKDVVWKVSIRRYKNGKYFAKVQRGNELFYYKLPGHRILSDIINEIEGYKERKVLEEISYEELNTLTTTQNTQQEQRINTLLKKALLLHYNVPDKVMNDLLENDMIHKLEAN